ncbi:MAG: carbohydrate binding family 9 domain-containing protein [Gemmatimonadetes bacterium]|nr:carbohydrate binding family 9 domain-containing protein [Gemmatimonadota bacterium]
MILPTLLALMAFQDPAPVFSGRSRQIAVRVPRIDSSVVVDGNLDEPAWRRAARLTEFSQFQPVDGRAAEEPTEVLVWYAPDAIHFGIRARELHGDVVRATRANRDNIASEDHVQILLDTYNDRRIAFLFGVNALGVQQDGTRSDNFGGGAGGRSGGSGGVGGINPLDGSVDLNPDYVFESKGRMVDGGYEVEIRIPFKSLRYQEGRTQTWGINVLRRVQHSGFQDVWTPAVRANASFLGQAGTLEGLTDMRRGLVLEMTPTVTGRLDGAPDPLANWKYDGVGDFGADVRWGISQNLTMNGTVNPDFSQVEADVGQVTLNERFALFYPEKRPFFLDGLELFDTPNQLIYTRRIGNPDAGIKLAGKVGRLNIAAMAAADGSDQSTIGARTPVFGVTRLRTDLGRSSTLGAVLTTREEGGDYSRLAGADLRFYHNKLYYVEVQAVESWTETGGTGRSGPLLEAAWDRTGRRWGFHYSAKAIAPDFNAAAGFVNRTGIIEANAFNRLSGYGRPGALVETYGAFMGIGRIWDYSEPGDGTIEGNESIFPSATLRGGWQLGGSLTRAYYSYAPADYAGLEVAVPGDTVAFAVPGQEKNQVGGSIRVTTPTYRLYTLSVSASVGNTPIFREAAPGRSSRFDATIDLRPSGAVRAAFQLTRQTISRRRDGSRYSSETIPRLKVEYQASRAVFFRFIGQYSARERSPWVDRQGRPVLVGGIRDTGDRLNDFRVDWLFSYRPTPGTLFYLGYGATLTEPRRFRFRELERTVDGFFAKASYLFRL